MKRTLIFIMAVIASMLNAATDTFPVHQGNNAPSLLPKGKKWKLVWSDEFNGNELDRSKWGFRLYFWGKRFKAFSDKGVEVSNGTLKLHLVKNPDGSYCSAHLQTGSLTFDIPKDTPARKFWPFGKHVEPTFMHRFGYYEVRCKLPKYDGWHSAFWLQAPGIGSHPDPRYAGVEVDIMENYNYFIGNKIVGGPIWGGYGKNNKRSGHFQWPHHETDDKWHYYGVDWKVDGYDFYIDGKLVGSTTIHKDKVAPVYDSDGKPCGGTLYGAVSHVEQFILLSTEVHGYRAGDTHDPLLDKAVLPDYFEIDHVRVYDDINLNFENLAGSSDFSNIKQDEPDMFDGKKQ